MSDVSIVIGLGGIAAVPFEDWGDKSKFKVSWDLASYNDMLHDSGYRAVRFFLVFLSSVLRLFRQNQMLYLSLGSI